MMHRIDFLCRGPVAALALLVGGAFAAEPPHRPNLLVIITDDQGMRDYGASGATDVRTPHIDRIFREGMTFENFYANSCVCSPTRAALLTGCHPDRVGVPGVIREQQPAASWGWLAPDAVLLPRLLRPAGYHSAIVGKWHLGLSAPNRPNDRGFDLFHGFLDDMVDDCWKHTRHGSVMMRHNLEPVRPTGHATDVFTDWACGYLEERATAGGPFFLYLAYNAPHTPIQPPPEWLARVQQRQPELPEKRARFVAFVEHLDAGIGRVLDTLDRTKLAANTIVLFTSDNGGELAAGSDNAPWRSGKLHMYEGGLRVPGAVRWPGVVRAGSRTDRITLSMDVFPTACAIAGVDPPADIDGVSFAATLRGEPETAPPRDLYFVRREGWAGYGGKTAEAFRRGKWKLVQDGGFAPLELFDLEADPAETRNVAAANPKVVAELVQALSRHVQRAGRVPWQPAAAAAAAAASSPAATP